MSRAVNAVKCGHKIETKIENKRKIEDTSDVVC